MTVSTECLIPVVLTDSEFAELREEAGYGCKSWACEIDDHADGFKIQEWKEFPHSTRYEYVLHEITPAKVLAEIENVIMGRYEDKYGLLRNVKKHWLCRREGDFIDREMANTLVQLVAFQKVIYG